MKKTLLLILTAHLLTACGTEGTTDLIPEVTEDFGGRPVEDATADPGTVAPELVTKDTLDLFLPDSTDVFAVQECEPGEGCFLDQCTENSNCLSGWCVDHMGEGVCTISCQDECPEGWSCNQVMGTGPDVVYICISDHSTLCRPCATAGDCDGAAGVEAACVAYGAGENFCGSACEASEGKECPWGFTCQEAETVDGVVLQQCVADAGVCPCTAKSVELGLWTSCEQANDWGLCTGKRVCTEEGLSDCDATVPAEETCNGTDDNCDGQVDEDTCDDENSCTTDACNGEDGCSHDPLTEGECLDGDSCTIGDHCEAGECVGSPIACDDDNPCTDDSCDGLGGCLFHTNTEPCDDGDPCTVGDLCADGECHGVAVSCDCQSDEDCAQFDDADACTGDLFCDTAALPYQCAVVPGSIVDCPAPEGLDAVCLQAMCDPDTGECSLAPDHEGFACDDADPCTVGDKCVAGACSPGVPSNCADDNPCTDDSCDPGVGCLHVNNLAPCQDGDACTTSDACFEGDCLGGAPKACNDENVCTDDSCDPLQGCIFEPNTLPCDDGNACTTGDVCAAGACTFADALECNDGNICTDDQCDPVAGCLHVNNTAPCDDGDECTAGDTCADGVCLPGAGAQCNDGNECTADSCAPGGGCLHEPMAGECDDGNACTEDEQCKNGECTPGSLMDCNDDNICTDDACDPVQGCVHTLNEAPCDDADLCTIQDHCHLGQCIGGGDYPCDDGNVCTDDGCSPQTGCIFNANSLPCDDGNACTADDKCDNGWCAGLTPVTCDDGNICTDDSCDPVEGCVFDTNALPCDDGSACTTGDQCLLGQCFGAVQVACADGNPCTDDFCDPDTGCFYENNSDGCDDLDACTDVDACAGGACVPGAPVVCEDDNLCTDNTCEPATGCVFDTNTVPCDDGNACTTGDACGGGGCLPGAGDLDCDDLKPCTTDTCAPQIGCEHEILPDGTECGPGKICESGLCKSDSQASCLGWKLDNPAAPDGVYTVDPDGDGGNAPFDVYCDMTADDGGWTLVYRNNISSALQPHNEGQQGNVASLQSVGGGSAKYSDSVINSLRAYNDNRIGYRCTSPTVPHDYFFSSSCGYYHEAHDKTECRRYLYTYTDSNNPSYIQCTNWGGAAGGLDAWYGCGGTSGYTNVVKTHSDNSRGNACVVDNYQGNALGHAGGVVQSGAPQGCGYNNNLLMWVR